MHVQECGRRDLLLLVAYFVLFHLAVFITA